MSAALVLLLALALAPQDAGEAQALWDQGRHEEALASWSAALERDPEDVELRRRLAARLMEAQRPQAALQVAQALGPEAQGLRGIALYLLARHEEALQHLSAGDPQQALLRVECLEALGRAEEAAAAVDQAAAALGARHPRVLVLRARRLAADGAHEQALPLLREAVAADPLDREALFALGQALVRSGAREEGLALLQRHRELLPLLDARDFALQSLALDPAHAANHARVGDAERELGRLDEAEAAYRTAAGLARDASERVPVALRHARLLHEQRGDLDAALALLQAAAARAPDARLLVRAGDLLAAAGRDGEARAQFTRALALRPGDAQIEARLAALPPAAESP